jgi:ribosomal protein S18 acetylase RimI-like enzyme
VPITVRAAEPRDVEAVVAMAAHLNALVGEPTEHLDAAALARDGLGPGRAFDALVAERDGTLVGYAFLEPSYASEWAARGAYLIDLYVVPEARRQGVGRRLLAACAAHARARGLSFLWWCSKPWNEPANAFYRALGAVREPILAHALSGPAFARAAELDQGEDRPAP